MNSFSFFLVIRPTRAYLLSRTLGNQSITGRHTKEEVPSESKQHLLLRCLILLRLTTTSRLWNELWSSRRLANYAGHGLLGEDEHSDMITTSKTTSKVCAPHPLTTPNDRNV
ncbi:hypothetical protein B0T26DRAFT_333769 [Lasiosphaeria miniovina]|uniref:Uncharacterized protein n=1 Tax=Lasiosphaeria miniovina TaxID=1954250 RepID=A0AA40AMJ1_9PEZI|nr:uncharacterized protein B0T26DRAFT_333769 [Lasiosphaeria miniovina]KAK0718601.1 hypothetical protein B0T26DRAFT_333769 [Lasiosphaeria miniovina]